MIYETILRLEAWFMVALRMGFLQCAALRTWFRRKRIYYFRQVDRNAKCPACGHRLGDIVFSAEAKMLVHKCFVCRAEFGEKPVVDTDEWLAPPPPSQPADSNFGF
jgi:DNA-directed RNA polymerase subunit RPC12/RpoP